MKFDEKDDIFEIFQLKPNSNPPIKVEVVVNSKLIVMEVDTGASTSLINHKALARIQDGNTKMEPTCSKIQTYTGEIMKPKGCTNIQLEYNGQKTKETVIIGDGNYSNLLDVIF